MLEQCRFQQTEHPKRQLHCNKASARLSLQSNALKHSVHFASKHFVQRIATVFELRIPVNFAHLLHLRCLCVRLALFVTLKETNKTAR